MDACVLSFVYDVSFNNCWVMLCCLFRPRLIMETFNHFVFKGFLCNSNGTLIRNDKDEILCEIIESNGTTSSAFVSSTILNDCGLMAEGTATKISELGKNVSWDAATSTATTTAMSTAPPMTSSYIPIADRSQTCELWKTSKTQSQKDHDATLVLLDLRKQFDKDFMDKKNGKNVIWHKIADHMNSMGYYVGKGTDGREKVRQKFANLQTSYLKFIQKRKLTGEGAVDTPPYYTEMNEILGDKHKICPPVVVDSEILTDNEKSDKENKSEETPCSTKKQKAKMPHTVSDRESCESSTPTTSNRFMEIKKSCRPQKERVVDVIKNIHKENLEQRKEEFITLVELLREESRQRHAQVMALLNKKKRSGEKSKRDTDSESD
ncbi:uncharacterized protein LOC111692536 [Anoplophora glabripennis]|uniref:uncharacterized protein LOC111692536 n=1 Tax=Anoplophora glabripennis TaxID=217634 RepID=UPI000C77290E|nr:uncharacterized protein LOC111692536 [Anoplophora glabripennis]